MSRRLSVYSSACGSGSVRRRFEPVRRLSPDLRPTLRLRDATGRTMMRVDPTLGPMPGGEFGTRGWDAGGVGWSASGTAKHGLSGTLASKSSIGSGDVVDRSNMSSSLSDVLHARACRGSVLRHCSVDDFFPSLSPMTKHRSFRSLSAGNNAGRSFVVVANAGGAVRPGRPADAVCERAWYICVLDSSAAIAQVADPPRNSQAHKSLSPQRLDPTPHV